MLTDITRIITNRGHQEGEMNLNGQTALVTGSSRNIGQTIATTLAEAGADVGITARNNEEGCRETARQVKEIGRDAAVALGDLAEPTDIERIVESVRNELGQSISSSTTQQFVRRRHFSKLSLQNWTAF